MTRRHRRPTPPDEFQDPLRDYSPATFTDGLERSLCQDSVTTIQSQPAPIVSPDTTIERAMQVLDGLDIACLLVAEDDRLVGVFTERDVLNKVAEHYHDLKDHPVREVMTCDPIVVYETDHPAAVMSVMAANGLRHVPVLDVDDRIIGVVSPKRVTGFLQQHFEPMDD